MKKLLIKLINFYRNYMSYIKLPTCRYYPTCSQYAIESIQKKGLAGGLYSTIRRILRCHPFSKGGYDPVE